MGADEGAAVRCDLLVADGPGDDHEEVRAQQDGHRAHDFPGFDLEGQHHLEQQQGSRHSPVHVTVLADGEEAVVDETAAGFGVGHRREGVGHVVVVVADERVGSPRHQADDGQRAGAAVPRGEAVAAGQEKDEPGRKGKQRDHQEQFSDDGQQADLPRGGDERLGELHGDEGERGDAHGSAPRGRSHPGKGGRLRKRVIRWMKGR